LIVESTHCESPFSRLSPPDSAARPSQERLQKGPVYSPIP